MPPERGGLFLKSDVVVIGRRPVMNTSLALRLYTERAGLVEVVAKGAFRKRRRDEPPSVPDLFQRGEVVLWMNPRHERAILREWSLDEVRSGLRADYERFRAASGCAALVAALSPDSMAGNSAEGGEHFRALDEALTELDRGGAAGTTPLSARPGAVGTTPLSARRGAVRPVLWGFVLHELGRAGFLAPVGSCAVCGCAFGRAKGVKRVDAEPCGEAVGLAPGAGGFVCLRCRTKVTSESEDGEDGTFIPLVPEAAAAARFLAASPIGAASKLKASPRASSALERAVRALAEYHVERAMPALSPERPLRPVEV